VAKSRATSKLPPPAPPPEDEPVSIGATEPPHLGQMAKATGFLLRRAAGILSNHYRDDLAQAGIPLTPVQGGMLILIDENPGLTQIELARLLAVEGSTLSLSLSRLLEQGFVQRYRLPQDQRAYALHLTRSGRAVRNRLDDLMMKHQDVVLSTLSAGEREILNEMLLRIIERGDEIAAENGGNSA